MTDTKDPATMTRAERREMIYDLLALPVAPEVFWDCVGRIDAVFAPPGPSLAERLQDLAVQRALVSRVHEYLLLSVRTADDRVALFDALTAILTPPPVA